MNRPLPIENHLMDQRAHLAVQLRLCAPEHEGLFLRRLQNATADLALVRYFADSPNRCAEATLLLTRIAHAERRLALATLPADRLRWTYQSEYLQRARTIALQVIVEIGAEEVPS
jgi:hypothetical protein